MKQNDLPRKDSGIDQLMKYAADLSAVYKSEKEKREKLEVVYAQLMKAARFEALGKMAGSLAHDLNNLLAVISMVNQDCRKSEDLGLIQRELKIQAKGISLMSNLSENLARLAGRQKTQRKLFPPSEVVNDSLGILEKRFSQKNITVKTSFSEGILIFGDPGQYAQICLNLLVNSMDAIGSNGRIDIEISHDGGFVLSRFTDTGQGMPPENLDKIFDLLFTTKPQGQGTGIGLFTFKEIVTEHGGRIDVQSEVGQGTIFSFWLPSSEDNYKPKEQKGA